MVSRCKWCGKITNELTLYRDAIGEEHNICSSCLENAENNKCRKCGVITDSLLILDGLCTTCVQVKINEQSRRKEEARMGVDRELTDSIISELELTDEDYEQWLTMGKTFSDSDMANSVELKRIWIMVKLNASGIYDNDVIGDNIEDIESLLDRNFSKLVRRKCKLLIALTPQDRQLIRESNVVDYENKVYILE